MGKDLGKHGSGKKVKIWLLHESGLWGRTGSEGRGDGKQGKHLLDARVGSTKLWVQHAPGGGGIGEGKASCALQIVSILHPGGNFL